MPRTLPIFYSALLLTGCTQPAPQTQAPQDATTVTATDPAPTEEPGCLEHVDENDDDICDECGHSVIITIDFYNINDLHGKIFDGELHPGVDEMTTYLRNAQATKDNVILLSSGDMWQGSAESNLTAGALTTAIACGNIPVVFAKKSRTRTSTAEKK